MDTPSKEHTDSIPLGLLKRSSLNLDQAPWRAPALTPEDIALIKKHQIDFSQIEVAVYLGTWCGDCHEQIPTFLSLMEHWGIPEEKIHLFGLDREKTFPDFLNIHQVEKLPTIVFLKDAWEMGRIVETPRKSLIEDSLEILSHSKSCTC